MAFDNLRVKESESYRLDWFLNTQGLENEGEEAWHGTWLASPKPETLKEKNSWHYLPSSKYGLFLQYVKMMALTFPEMNSSS